MPMTIGEVAAKARVNLQTIRYYERRALIPDPPRTPSGYRQYPEQVVRTVLFIKRAEHLGFSLDEISELLTLGVLRSTASADSELQIQASIARIDQKIGDLRRLQAALEGIVEALNALRTGQFPVGWRL